MKTNCWSLFLDDVRDPVSHFDVVCRDYKSAIEEVMKWGLPSFMSLDHDLGEDKTGLDFAKFIVEYCLDSNLVLTTEFMVHSQNPVGKANIEGLLNGFKSQKT